jgi:hypothetical protein
MSNTATYLELRKRYSTAWTPPSTEYPNEKFVTPTNAIWARFTIIDGEERQIDIGARQKTFRTPGQLVIQMFAPIDQGITDVLEKADSLADLFRNWRGLVVKCKEVSVEKIGNDGEGWYQVNTTVFYTVEMVKTEFAIPADTIIDGGNAQG